MTRGVRLVWGVAAWCAGVALTWTVSLVMPPCWMNVLLGIPCPACGSSRMLDALLQGKVLDAFLLNPFFFVLAPVSLAIVSAAALIGPSAFLQRLERWSPDTWLRIAYVTAAAMLLNWIYLLNFGTW